MSEWATAEQVIQPCPDLRDSSELAERKLGELMEEAKRHIKADLAGAYHEDVLDRLDPVPSWLTQLLVTKTRELAFIAWRAGPGEQAKDWRDTYTALLDAVRMAPGDYNTGRQVSFT